MKKLWSVIGAVSILSLVYGNAFAGSLDIPVKGYGLSFGNSQNFTGVRFNVLDKEVHEKLEELREQVGEKVEKIRTLRADYWQAVSDY